MTEAEQVTESGMYYPVIALPVNDSAETARSLVWDGWAWVDVIVPAKNLPKKWESAQMILAMDKHRIMPLRVDQIKPMRDDGTIRYQCVDVGVPWVETIASHITFPNPVRNLGPHNIYSEVRHTKVTDIYYKGQDIGELRYYEAEKYPEDNVWQVDHLSWTHEGIDFVLDEDLWDCYEQQVNLGEAKSMVRNRLPRLIRTAIKRGLGRNSNPEQSVYFRQYQRLREAE